MNVLFKKIQLLRSLTTQNQGKRKYILRTFVAVITILSLYLAFRGIDWTEFFAIIKTANYGLLPVVVVISSLNYLLRSLRWRALLTHEHSPAVMDIFWSNMIGYFGNNVFPARAGELIRAFYVGMRCRISKSYVFSTCVLERLGDVFALILIGFVSLVSMHSFTGGLVRAIEIFMLLAILCLIFLIFLPKLKHILFRVFGKLSFFQKFQQPIERAVNHFSSGIEILSNKRVVITFILYTVVIWFVDAYTTILGASIFHLDLNLPIAFLLLTALGLSSAIPSTPGYIGVYQYVAVLVLVPFGFTQETAVAYMTASQVIGFILIGFWGLLGLLILPIQKKSSLPQTEPSEERYNQ